MALRAPKQVLAVASCAALAFAACTSERAPGGSVVMGETTRDTHDHGRTANVSQDLSASNFFGTSLPAKTLALTFDDGPGPRTKELSAYLKSQNIKAAFFMNGARLVATALPNPNGINPVADPGGTLAQVLADGHLVANHTTTHRDLTGLSDAQRVQELTETDTDIAGFVSPQNHLLFRAPYGAYNNAVFNALSPSPMNKYVGPIYWEAGGYDTGFPDRAADWACWQGGMKDGGGALINVGNDPGFATTEQCGDAYVKEIDVVFKNGIVLMHDPYSWASGSTVDMVKYIVPILIAKGYSFVRVDEVPAIAAALPPPPCDPTCATCSAPDANHCTACLGGRYKSGGQCLACSTCNANQYQLTACTTTADTTCGACNAGCATCTGPSATECASCAAGKFLSGGACTACTSCAAGKYASTACTPTADTVCSACDASCTSCFGPSAAQCGSCPPSFYASAGACHACKVCDAGSVKATACTATTDTTCTKCPAGTFAATGASSCSACPAGTTSGPGASSCTACSGCDDGNACTQDRCDAVNGCVHEPILGCQTNSGTSGGVTPDAGPDSGGEVVVDTDSGCSISGTRSGNGSEHDARAMVVLAALGLSFAVRRRRQPAP
jgi:MYXO-CTERM domain-containing protein